jgi:hypothetical protein
VALAARAMPRASLPVLIEWLQRQLGERSDEDNLDRVTENQLKTGFASAAGGAADAVIGRFQQAMAESPPPWLLKILGVAAENRLKNYNAATVDD